MSTQSVPSHTYTIKIPTHHRHPSNPFKMGILRSHTTKNITTTTTAAPPKDDDVKIGITRSATDPVSEEKAKQIMNNGRSSGSGSPPSSGTSSPRRKTNSIDIVRNIRERPSSAIPKYHVLAEQVHRFKMRNCPGMEATAEEQAGIKEMKRWSWKSCGHPGACAPPIGPRNETWYFDPEDASP